MSQSNINIAELFAPTADDIEYTVEDWLTISLICRTDSYKFGHPYVKLNSNGRKIVGMSSYGEARTGKDDEITPFGMQMFLKNYFSKPITMDHIDLAEKFAIGHFGRPLFARADWEKVVREYKGYLPLIIRGLPEGTVAHGGLPLYSATCLDRDLAWMSAGIETIILRGNWYATTIASMDRDIKKFIKHAYEVSGADLGGLGFALHDFGGRGVTCAEQAEIGGAAHLLNFMGSDTVEGVLAANFYYKNEMAAYSVAATEHSIECSFGLDVEGERDYLITTIKAFMAPGAIVSIVIDGKDTLRCANALCNDPEIKALVIELANMGGKVVFRPDSGEMMDLIPAILQMQEAAYGSVTNDKGFRKINCVGVILGDGIDRQGMKIRSILGKIMSMGFRADNVIFGSGGGLLQGVTRDTKKFAQKASAILVETTKDDGSVVTEWEGIAKDPITDQGKKSKEGVMTTARNKATGELKAMRLDRPMEEGYEDAFKLFYHTGRFFNETTLDEARARSAV